MMGLRPAPYKCSMAIIFAREPKVWLKRSKSVTNSKVWMKEEVSVYLYALGYLRLADARGFCVIVKGTGCPLKRAKHMARRGEHREEFS